MNPAVVKDIVQDPSSPLCGWVRVTPSGWAQSGPSLKVRPQEPLSNWGPLVSSTCESLSHAQSCTSFRTNLSLSKIETKNDHYHNWKVTSSNLWNYACLACVKMQANPKGCVSDLEDVKRIKCSYSASNLSNFKDTTFASNMKNRRQQENERYYLRYIWNRQRHSIISI